MTNGLYGYYDTKNEYVVYIGKDVDIGNDKRHKEHYFPSFYDNQVINRVIQNNTQRYTYFRFIEGEYDDETLKDLEREAIQIFKTYKYDYPERNVFNFTKGGDGAAEGQGNPNWREKDYNVIKAGTARGKNQYAILGRNRKVIKHSFNKKKLKELSNKLNKKEITEEEVKNLQLWDGNGQNNPNWRNKDYSTIKAGMRRKKQQYAIKGRYGDIIKYSFNKKKLEELTNKLNNKEITEEEAKNFKLCDKKEIAKKTGQANAKYNMWNVSYCHYKRNMFKNNGGDKPRKCFKYKYKHKDLPIGGFHDSVTCQIIDSIVKEEVKKCKHDN